MSEKTPQEEAILDAARKVVDLELRVFQPYHVDRANPEPTPAHSELVAARLELRKAVLEERMVAADKAAAVSGDAQRLQTARGSRTPSYSLDEHNRRSGRAKGTL